MSQAQIEANTRRNIRILQVVKDCQEEVIKKVLPATFVAELIADEHNMDQRTAATFRKNALISLSKDKPFNYKIAS